MQQPLYNKFYSPNGDVNMPKITVSIEFDSEEEMQKYFSSKGAANLNAAKASAAKAAKAETAKPAAEPEAPVNDPAADTMDTGKTEDPVLTGGAEPDAVAPTVEEVNAAFSAYLAKKDGRTVATARAILTEVGASKVSDATPAQLTSLLHAFQTR